MIDTFALLLTDKKTARHDRAQCACAIHAVSTTFQHAASQWHIMGELLSCKSGQKNLKKSTKGIKKMSKFAELRQYLPPLLVGRFMAIK